MTEALRPRQGAIGLPGRREATEGSSDPRRGIPADAPAGARSTTDPLARPKAVAAARTRGDARRPYHLGVFLGLSAGAYAVSLAGVTAFQSSTEAATAAERAPIASAVAALQAGHDALERQLADGRSAYEAAGAGYRRVADRLDLVQRQLDGLAASVGRIEGGTTTLPTSVSLPSLPRSVAVAPAPAIHATTGASGKP